MLASVALWLAFRSDGDRDGQHDTVAGADAATASGEAGGAAPVVADAAPRAAHATRTLAITLRAIDGASPDPGSIEAGLAYIDAADVALLATEGDDPEAGAGPESIASLANVAQWVRVPGERTSAGDVLAAPVPAHADRVRLVASGGGLAYYAIDLDPVAPPAEVRPRFAGGVRVRVDGEAGPVGIEWHPAGRWPDASLWQDVIERSAPEVLAASRDRPIVFEQQQVLAPLPPGAAIELSATADGIEVERRAVTIVPGRIVDVVFDAARIESARELAVELALEVVARGSGQPLAFADLVLQRPAGEERQRTDLVGRAAFASVDRRVAHAVTIEPPQSPGPLPAWPARRALEITIDDEEGRPPERRVLRRVEVDALRYLVLALPRTTSSFGGLAERPYPIYALERADGGGWRDTSSDHFVPLDSAIAVAVGEPGRYRVVAATSPWHLLRSHEVVVSDGSPQRLEVALATPAAAARAIRIVEDGTPVANRAFTIRGPHRSMPPLVRTTDANGRIALGAANVDRIALDLPHLERESVVELDAGETLVDIAVGPQDSRSAR